MTHSDPDLEAAASLGPQLAAARTGSTEALGQLLELCRAYLLGVANRELESSLQAKAGASDLVQEAFLESQRIFHRFQGQSPDELLPWLRAILLNKLEDFRRQYRATEKRRIDREVTFDTPTNSGRTTGVVLAGATPTPSSLVAQDEQTQALLKALDKLPEHYRQVIVWRQWDELSFEEIARRLGKSVDAARMVWWRAVERLQEAMGPAP